MRVLIVLTIFCSFASCDESRVFEENSDIENKIWIADSILNFDIDIQESKETYNLYINIRNSVSYPYENIYLTYYLKDTLGNQLESELVNFNLFDPKTGRPLGDGLGDIFDHQFLVLDNYKFQKPGRYVLQLQQYMRMDSLPEILSAGIRVDKKAADKQDQ